MVFTTDPGGDFKEGKEFEKQLTLPIEHYNGVLAKNEPRTLWVDKVNVNHSRIVTLLRR